MKHKTFTSAFIVLLFISLSTNLSYGQDYYEVSTPLNPGMARIVFHRGANLLGVAGSHIVIDKGDSLNFNGCVYENKTYTTDQYNFGKAGNVKLLYLKINYREGIKLIGKTPKGDTYVETPFNIADFPTISTIPGPIKKIIIDNIPISGLGIVGHAVAEELGYYKNIDSKTPNCRIVGAVESGDSFFWDRPAGTMIIQNITSGGDQAFAQPIKVEAGKTYSVDYHYASSKFDISESKGFNGSNKDTITNENIIKMTKEGYTADFIIALIHKGICKFDLSSGEIAHLNRQLVFPEVIEEMKKCANTKKIGNNK